MGLRAACWCHNSQVHATLIWVNVTPDVLLRRKPNSVMPDVEVPCRPSARLVLVNGPKLISPPFVWPPACAPSLLATEHTPHQPSIPEAIAVPAPIVVSESENGVPAVTLGKANDVAVTGLPVPPVPAPIVTGLVASTSAPYVQGSVLKSWVYVRR